MSLTLAIYVLAVWRGTHLLVYDEVPFGQFRLAVVRRFPKYGWGLGCIFCMSCWTGLAAALIAYFLRGTTFDPTPGLSTAAIILLAPGLSATTIALEGVIDWLTSAPDHD